MSAVVRIKRTLDELPLEGLVLSCKRRKTDSGESDAIKTVFKFAGTVKDRDENVALVVSSAVKRDDVKTVSKPDTDISGKVRLQAKASSERSRFKLVNYFRSLNDSDIESGGEGDAKKKPLTVLEVESECNKTTNKEEVTDGTQNNPGSTEYVYDVYYTEPEFSSVDIDDLLLDGMISVAALDTDLVFETYRNNRAAGCGSDSDSPIPDDEDDSNDENNWRNDYPDEDVDPDEDSDIEYRRRGIECVHLGDEELSSDEEDEMLYQSNLSEGDVALYGAHYASYKKRVTREFVSDADSDSEKSSEVVVREIVSEDEDLIF